MDGILRVTPEELISASGEFETKAGVVQNLTGEMLSLINGLKGVWEGEAAMAYTDKFNQLEDDITRMVAMIKEHSADLAEMGRNYQEAETENVQETTPLSGDVIV